ncbi:MAG: thrombospondin type 3 repeat-containing protein, partial [Lentisphaerota bacterium]
MAGLSQGQTTRFVSKAGSHQAPFTSWEGASTNIQAALDAAQAGDAIQVADGVYREAEIVIQKSIAISSLHGAAATVIDAGSAHRCLSVLTNALVEGFTLTGGFAEQGGGAKMTGGELRQCRITGNSAQKKGAGVHCFFGGKVTRSEISGNSVAGNDGGGGVYLEYGGEVSFCVVVSNRAAQKGGGIYCDRGGSVIRNCAISLNTARYGGGVMFFTAAGNGYEIGEMNNCLVTGNTASYRGGGVYANLGGEMYNCTIVDNCASNRGGGVYWSIDQYGLGVCVNSIIYYNQSPDGADYYNNNGYFVRCCTTPDPGYNSIAAEPRFADRLAGDYHLAADSPCINAGNSLYVIETDLDLDGCERVVDTSVDLGAYECQVSANQDSDGDGLPDSVETGTGVYQGPGDTGTSPYVADTDGDGVRDGDEVAAGFDPTDPESVFVIRVADNSSVHQ